MCLDPPDRTARHAALFRTAIRAALLRVWFNFWETRISILLLLFVVAHPPLPRHVRLRNDAGGGGDYLQEAERYVNVPLASSRGASQQPHEQPHEQQQQQLPQEPPSTTPPRGGTAEESPTSQHAENRNSNGSLSSPPLESRGLGSSLSRRSGGLGRSSGGFRRAPTIIKGAFGGDDEPSEAAYLETDSVHLGDLLEALLAFFRAADRDGDGMLTEDEFQQAVAIYRQQHAMLASRRATEATDALRGQKRSAVRDAPRKAAEEAPSNNNKDEMSQRKLSFAETKRTLSVVFGMDNTLTAVKESDVNIDEVYGEAMKKLGKVISLFDDAYDQKEKDVFGAIIASREEDHASIGIDPEWLFKYAKDEFAKEHDYSDAKRLKELQSTLMEMADYLDSPLEYTIEWRVLFWPIYFFVVANVAKILTKYAVWGIDDYADSSYVNYERC